MCGITGLLNREGGRSAADLLDVVRGMSCTIAHRGPDDEAHFVDEEAGIALGFRRLAILDLTPDGRQPMRSACGRYTMVFNGEVYNFRDLRASVERSGKFRFGFRGRSDTEIVLAAMTIWGVAATLPLLNGMFAMAIWDHERRELVLARDRIGKKPLYYGRIGGSFVFGSELKTLRAFPGFDADVDVDALGLFFRHNYIPSPFTIYRGFWKLLPGAMLTVDSRGRDTRQQFWSAKDMVELARRDPFRGSDAEALRELERVLHDAVGLRMVADVPVGAFLSGGIDSSLVVALMQAQQSARVKTFTIGFSEKRYDEAPFARMVAQQLRTEHSELYVTPREAMDVIPSLPQLYDEPFADSSQIPTFLVSRLARQSVTVALSGDGGDELFGGYSRYALGNAIWRALAPIPRSMRGAIRRLLTTPSPASWTRVAGMFGPVLPERVDLSRVGDRIHKLAEMVGATSPSEVYLDLISHWRDPRAIVPRACIPVPTLAETVNLPPLADSTDAMMYLDLITYLPDDILVKVDRASMGVSLEARAPLLDVRVAELAWRLPLSLKVRDGKSKWLLRQLLYKHVPRELIERPKTGFALPIGEWLRGALRPWAEELLDRGRIQADGILDPAEVSRKWQEHLSGDRNWQYHLWNILMFQAWLADSRDTGSEADRSLTPSIGR